MQRSHQFIADACTLLDSGFAAQAIALGWTLVDLFGRDEVRPFARVDKKGLVWPLNGNRLVAITAEVAITETKSGARQTFRQRQVLSAI